MTHRDGEVALLLAAERHPAELLEERLLPRTVLLPLDGNPSSMWRPEVWSVILVGFVTLSEKLRPSSCGVGF